MNITELDGERGGCKGMLRKILESNVGPVSNSKFAQLMDLTTTDIRVNHIAYGKRTSLTELVEVAVSCYTVLGRVMVAKHGSLERRERLIRLKCQQWFIEFSETTGRKYLNHYAIGIIGAIVGDLSTTEKEMVSEIKQVLKELKKVSHDDSLPWYGTDEEKALRANGEPRGN